MVLNYINKMKILIFVTFLIYQASGQLLGGVNLLDLPELPIATLLPISVSDILQLVGGTIAPGARYATSLEDLTNLGLNVSAYDESTLEDAFLKAPQLIKKYGYPIEIHTVVTSDDYILEMHRIPGSPKATNNGQPKQPIFLMHGLLDSSSTWVIMRPDQGLGYLLADMGYDVWMGNSRGNRYSRRHVSLDPDGSSGIKYKYWDFSWHEIGIYDLPAMIDYILSKTGFKKLQYIGHSQGGAVGLVLTSQLPEYNDKLISMHLMASGGYMSNAEGILLQLAALLQGPLKLALRDLIGMYELLPSHDLITLLARVICQESLLLQPLVCTNVLFLLAGASPEQLNTDMLPILVGHFPAGAATNNLYHFLQLVSNDRFCAYDRGTQKNLAKYGQSTPPDYNLANIRIPVAMYHSDNDKLIAAKDIQRVADRLSNLIENYKVRDPKFNHMDFIIGKDVVELLYKRVFENLKLSERGQSRLPSLFSF